MKRPQAKILHIVLLITSLFCAVALVMESIQLASLIQTKELTESTVEAKNVSNDLYGNVAFYAVTTNDDQIEISQKEYQTLTVGDTIEVNERNLFGNREFYISIFLIFLYLIGPVYYISFLVAQSKKAGWEWLTWPVILPLPFGFFAVLAALLIYGYTTMAQIGYNTIRSYTGSQNEVEAMIIAEESDINGGRFQSSYFYLTLSYQDENGNDIITRKEVRPSVYYDAMDTVSISHPDSNPYRIHTKGFGLSDVIFYFNRLFPQIMVLFLTLLLIICIRFVLDSSGSLKHRLKRNLERKAQSRRDKKKHRTMKKNKRKQDKKQKQRNKKQTKRA
ncbi:hypothetical protein SFC66_03930 [Terribacillus saccharophilus]|uniref:hypothetical protein n=1 Tax=Terribacillus saccharophilus TaxID=361277 RepID=UPI003981B24A